MGFVAKYEHKYGNIFLKVRKYFDVVRENGIRVF